MHSSSRQNRRGSRDGTDTFADQRRSRSRRQRTPSRGGRSRPLQSWMRPAVPSPPPRYRLLARSAASAAASSTTRPTPARAPLVRSPSRPDTPPPGRASAGSGRASRRTASWSSASRPTAASTSRPAVAPAPRRAGLPDPEQLGAYPRRRQPARRRRALDGWRRQPGGGLATGRRSRPPSRWRPWNSDKTWSEIRVPTLIIGGESDTVAPVTSHSDPVLQQHPARRRRRTSSSTARATSSRSRSTPSPAGSRSPGSSASSTTTPATSSSSARARPARASRTTEPPARTPSWEMPGRPSCGRPRRMAGRIVSRVIPGYGMSGFSAALH